jgi:RNA polymerase sigma-70 factor (ECF subfamily)
MTARETLDLVQRANAGNREALDQLFAREQPRLRRLLALRAGPALLRRLDLDDLAQEAIAEGLRQFATYSYQGRDSFFRWLAAIALHRLQNLRRVEQAEKRDLRRERPFVGEQTAQRVGGVTDAAAPAPGPRTLAAGSEGIERLHQALDRLAETDREVILLARFEGRSLAEIAERLGRTKNAVALLLSRALRKLKDELQ